MQAVFPSALCGGEPRDLGVRDAIALEARQGGNRRLQARLQRRRDVGVRDLDRRDHRLEVGGDAGRQQLRPGGEEAVRVDAARARNDVVERRLGQTDAAAFALQRRRLPIRLRRLRGGFLQHGQADLQAVVRRQTLLDQGGKKDGAFAKLFDDLDFRHHSGPS